MSNPLERKKLDIVCFDAFFVSLNWVFECGFFLTCSIQWNAQFPCKKRTFVHKYDEDGDIRS